MWLLPSRERPANLARFFDAYKKTGATTPGLVLLGPADGERFDYPSLPFGWSYVVCARDTQGEKIAEVWPQIESCTWFGLIGDDCVPETPGWDRRLVDSLDGANIVSCDDGWLAPARLGNCWVMSGDLVRNVGYIFAPRMRHLYVDDLWEEIGRGAQCWTVLMDVKVAHRHVLTGEAPADATHRAVYGADRSDPSRGMWPGDTEAFEAWKEFDRAHVIAEVVKLRQDKGLAIEAAKVAAVKAAIFERLKTRSVMIATPSAHPALEYAQSLFTTASELTAKGVRANLMTINGSSHLPKARNHLVAHFLAGDFTDLLFVDDDMGWDPDAVIRLLASDKPVIGAVGRKKSDKVEWCPRLQ